MNYDQIFYLANIISLLSWFALIIFPNAQITNKLVRSHLSIMVLSLIYLIIAVMAIFNKLPGGFSSLEKVSVMLSNDLWVLGAWIHFLVFDLFVGIWMVKDAEEKSYSHLSLFPFLFICLLFGPLGFLLYKIRLIVPRKL